MTENAAPFLGKNAPIIPISNSELQTFKDCRRKWWLGYYRGLQPKQRKIDGPLALGTRIHDALEAYYTNGSDPVEWYTSKLSDERMQLAADGQDLSKFDSEGELGRIMLEGYVEWLEETGADSQLEVIGAEEVLTAPLFDGRVQLQGKLDMRVRRKIDDVKLVVDHKALHVDQQVLTSTGYARIGDIKVGDELIAPDGSTTRVTGVYPQGVVDLFHVTFSDKSSVQACADHLWSVDDRDGNTYVLSTQEISERLFKYKQRQWSIPLVDGKKINFPLRESTLPLDPYVLGVLLGDGARRSTTFCSWDADIPDEVERRLYSDQRMHRKRGGVGFYISQELKPIPDERGRRYARSPLKHWLQTVGLWDCYSYEKFVPEDYLYRSYQERLDLLRGLMDTDGNVRKATGATLFVTTSQQLRDAVLWLVRSLGGLATTGSPTRGGIKQSDGTIKLHREVWMVSMQMPKNVCPFYLPRKAELWHQTRRVGGRQRMIYSIEPAGRGEAVCISVDHPDQLYITDHFIVTHNTVQSFDSITRTAHMNEQPMTYMLLEAANRGEDERCDGMIYNMLRKVKRSANATPPFYKRIEVHFNAQTMRSFWTRIHGTISDMLHVRQQLDEGTDPNLVAYPRPTQDCTWKCEFYAVCPLFDDGSAAEEFVDMYYQKSDPYARYEDESK